MTDTVCEWLPSEAVASGVVSSKLTEIISGWSTRWFASGQIGIAGLTACAHAPQEAGSVDWFVHRGGVAVRRSPAMTVRLVERTLGVRLEGIVLADADRRVLAGLIQQVVEDLVSTVEQALGLEGELRSPPLTVHNPFGQLGGLIVSISDARDQILALAIPLSPLAVLRKSSLSRPGCPVGGLGTLTEALKPIDVTVEATLGRAPMSMADVCGLSPGDIVVMDVAVDGGSEISLLNCSEVIGRARVSEIDGCLALTIQALSG